MIPQDITITEWWFVALVAVAFAYLGARRGLTVELSMLVSVVVGILLAERLSKFLEPWINFTYKVILAMVRERAFSPEALFQSAVKQPLLITQDYQRLIVSSIVFVWLVLLGYLIGRKRSAKAKPRLTTRALAAVVGAVNGYLVVYYLFPKYITTQKTVITMTNKDITRLLQFQLSLPILISVLVLITIGVLGAREGKPKGK